MKYQRRHYVQLAKMIADLRLSALDAGDLYMLETVDVFSARLATIFERDNPRFDQPRFLSACSGASANSGRTSKRQTVPKE